MTGPEHYQEAERLLKEVGKLPDAVVTLDPDATPADLAHVKAALGAERGWDVVAHDHSIGVNVTPLLLAAQVHATLAHTAAQVELELTAGSSLTAPAGDAWRKAIGWPS